jgi:dipeptidyl aminopeptidase/acylaminoacyl peptidase
MRTIIATLLLLSTAVAQTTPDTSYVPDIETFLQIGAAGGPQIGADGERVFFTSSMSGVAQLYRLTEEGWPYQLTVFPDGIDHYTLSPDGQSAIVGASVGGNEQSQLFWVDGTSGRPIGLTTKPDVQYGSAVFANDGRSIYYRSNEANGEDFHIYRMSVPDGAAERIYEAKGYNEPGDVSHDGRSLIVAWYESNENSDLYVLDLQAKLARHLTPHSDKTIYSSLGFTPDDRSLIILTNGNEDGIMRPALLDIATGKTSEPLPPSRWEVEDAALSPDGRLLALVYNEEGYGQLHIYDAVTFREQRVPPLDGIVSGVAFSDRRTAVFSFSSPTQAPDIWMWTRNAKTLKKLTHSIYAGIDPSLFREPELVKIKSFDGLEVPAFIYLPPGYSKGKAVPFIMDMHGGPESQFRPGFIRNFQYLILNGYGVLAPNVRGSSGYGKEYLAMDNYKLRMNSVKDAGAYAQWLIDEGYTTKDMLGIRGASYGGFMVLASITEFPDLFAAACDEVGIANFKSFLENTAAYRRSLREAEYGPLSDPDFLASISPLHKVDKIRTPLLVVHGENDPRVPVGEARQIATAIAKRGGVVDTLIFPDEGHGAAKRPNILKEYRTQVDFFDRHLKSRITRKEE